MKHILSIILFFSVVLYAGAQAPGMFKYQAVARDPNNQPYANTALRIRFAILENAPTGITRYYEEHNITTSTLGVFEANIGGGTVLQGSMNNVMLGNHAYFIKVELNPQPSGGNFITMGTSQLLSVPYALYAAQAASGGDQTLDISGHELSISNGNTVDLPQYTGGAGIQIVGQQITALDDSDTNELQYLDISDHTLSLSNGNSVMLPDDGFSLPYAGGLSSGSPLFSITNSGGGAAIYGVTYGGGDAAVVGEDPSGGLAGVRGYSSSSYGVLGYSDAGSGVLGQSGGGTGVVAESSGGAALKANNYGGGNAIETQGPIYVESNGNSRGIEVVGSTNFGFYTAGASFGIRAYGDTWGVEGGGDLTGVFGIANGSGGFGGYFAGKMYADVVQKGSGSFKIDHPLDPANKYLYHSFVESPDMMNIYNGNATTDAEGMAVIELPSYFETLNRDFRYQLTCIGTFAQVIVAREVSQHSFVIQSDKPNVKVSWQVTGIRQDAHANKYRIVPEVEKEPQNKGKYLCPDCYGQPEEKGMLYDVINHRDKDKK